MLRGYSVACRCSNQQLNLHVLAYRRHFRQYSSLPSTAVPKSTVKYNTRYISGGSRKLATVQRKIVTAMPISKTGAKTIYTTVDDGVRMASHRSRGGYGLRKGRSNKKEDPKDEKKGQTKGALSKTTKESTPNKSVSNQKDKPAMAASAQQPAKTQQQAPATAPKAPPQKQPQAKNLDFSFEFDLGATPKMKAEAPKVSTAATAKKGAEAPKQTQPSKAKQPSEPKKGSSTQKPQASTTVSKTPETKSFKTAPGNKQANENNAFKSMQEAMAAGKQVPNVQNQVSKTGSTPVKSHEAQLASVEAIARETAEKIVKSLELSNAQQSDVQSIARKAASRLADESIKNMHNLQAIVKEEAVKLAALNKQAANLETKTVNTKTITEVVRGGKEGGKGQPAATPQVQSQSNPIIQESKIQRQIEEVIHSEVIVGTETKMRQPIRVTVTTDIGPVVKSNPQPLAKDIGKTEQTKVKTSQPAPKPQQQPAQQKVTQKEATKAQVKSPQQKLTKAPVKPPQQAAARTKVTKQASAGSKVASAAKPAAEVQKSKSLPNLKTPPKPQSSKDKGKVQSNKQKEVSKSSKDVKNLGPGEKVSVKTQSGPVVDVSLKSGIDADVTVSSNSKKVQQQSTAGVKPAKETTAIQKEVGPVTVSLKAEIGTEIVKKENIMKSADAEYLDVVVHVLGSNNQVVSETITLKIKGGTNTTAKQAADLVAKNLSIRLNRAADKASKVAGETGRTVAAEKSTGSAAKGVEQIANSTKQRTAETAQNAKVAVTNMAEKTKEVLANKAERAKETVGPKLTEVANKMSQQARTAKDAAVEVISEKGSKYKEAAVISTNKIAAKTKDAVVSGAAVGAEKGREMATVVGKAAARTASKGAELVKEQGKKGVDIVVVTITSYAKQGSQVAASTATQLVFKVKDIASDVASKAYNFMKENKLKHLSSPANQKALPKSTNTTSSNTAEKVKGSEMKSATQKITDKTAAAPKILETIGSKTTAETLKPLKQTTATKPSQPVTSKNIELNVKIGSTPGIEAVAGKQIEQKSTKSTTVSESISTRGDSQTITKTTTESVATEVKSTSKIRGAPEQKQPQVQAKTKQSAPAKGKPLQRSSSVPSQPTKAAADKGKTLQKSKSASVQGKSKVVETSAKSPQGAGKKVVQPAQVQKAKSLDSVVQKQAQSKSGLSKSASSSGASAAISGKGAASSNKGAASSSKGAASSGGSSASSGGRGSSSGKSASGSSKGGSSSSGVGGGSSSSGKSASGSGKGGSKSASNTAVIPMKDGSREVHVHKSSYGNMKVSVNDVNKPEDWKNKPGAISKSAQNDSLRVDITVYVENKPKVKLSGVAEGAKDGKFQKK